MAESIFIENELTKGEKYEQLFPQIEALVQGEHDLIANLANIASALKMTFNFFWVGFYLVKNDQLILGPFQGPVACTRIQKGKGVCGSSWSEAKTLIVPDVEAFPGHIACNAASKSEIVVPIFNPQKEVCMVLDIDSDQLNDFDQTDKVYLEKIANLISSLIK
jgi:L-methionine (R)-S-oxide reductase